MTVKMGATDRQGISSLFWVSASIALITVFNLRFRYDGPAGRLRWHKRKCERLRRSEKHTGHVRFSQGLHAGFNNRVSITT